MSTELRQKVAGLRWYHTLELPGGVVTPGEYDLRPIVDRLPWPTSMRGMRCLDVGSRDGFYAFEMERRGAEEVISLDLDDPSKVDFPGTRPPDEETKLELDTGHRAFELAREALGSRVERRWLSVYELDPADAGGFDFAVIGTLLLHLRDPVSALRALRSVVTGELMINEVVIPGRTGRRNRPLAEIAMAEMPFWWIPNASGLRRLAGAAGFEVRRSSGPYLIPYGPGWEKPPLRTALGRPWMEIPRRLTLRRGAPHAWVLAG